jgi:hypothetical protein
VGVEWESERIYVSVLDPPLLGLATQSFCYAFLAWPGNLQNERVCECDGGSEWGVRESGSE